MAQYINKAAIAAEIVKIIADENESIKSFEHRKNVSELQRHNARVDLLNHLLSLFAPFEGKEIDLKKEAKKEYLKLRRYGGRDNMLVVLNELQFNDIAKHFFELGMKAQKGE